MPLYLVERYLPPDAEQLTSMVERVARLATADDAVRYRWCLVAPGDAAALCLFEAPDAGAVTDVNRRGGFPFDRITEVTVVRPDGSTSSSTRPAPKAETPDGPIAREEPDDE